MLNRIAAGAALAALPGGAFTAFAIAGMKPLALSCLGLAVLALIWTFAPQIPVLRDWLPAARRIKRLEAFWDEGFLLRHQAVPDLEAAGKEDEAWIEKAQGWIKSSISSVEARKFQMASASVDHHNTNSARDLRIQSLEGKLEYLLSLRDEQRRRIH